MVWLALYLTTIMVFVYGPLDWPVSNPLKLGLYLAAIGASVSTGYFFAGILNPAKAGPLNLRRIAYSGAIIGLLLAVPAMYLYTGKTPADLGAAINNQGQVYMEMVRTASAEPGGRLYFAALRSVLAPLTFAVVPLFILFWHRIPLGWRLVGILYVLSQLAFGVLRGTDKETVDLGIVIGVVLIAVTIRAWQSDQISGRRLMLMFISAAMLLVAVAGTFIWRKNARLGGESIAYCHQLTGLCADYENVFVSWLPRESRTGPIILLNYLSQGYYGLSLALDEPFTSSYGLGHSNFVLDKSSAFFGKELVDRTYVGKIESSGWKRKRAWSTLYIWIANDVGFIGTLFVMFLAGFVFGRSWKDFLTYGNGPALIFFVQMTLLFFYSSMNNQVMLSADQYFAFVVWLLIWLFSRRPMALGMGAQAESRS